MWQPATAQSLAARNFKVEAGMKSALASNPVSWAVGEQSFVILQGLRWLSSCRACGCSCRRQRAHRQVQCQGSRLANLKQGAWNSADIQPMPAATAVAVCCP